MGRLVLLLLCLTIAGCRAEDPAPVREVRIAAAADLMPVMPALREAFEAAHPDVAVAVTFGSSGKLYAQLLNRAPFDVYLSADADYARRLAAELRAEEGPFVYAIGRLAVWMREASAAEGIEVLLSLDVRRVAIANPEHAPYGRAAVAAMSGAGVYEQVKDRLVHADNVAQAMQFIETGAADAGVVALSLVVLREDAEVRGRIVPPGLHPAIEQGGLVLPWARDREAAETFRAFILSDAARQILKQGGFDLPEGEE